MRLLYLDNAGTLIFFTFHYLKSIEKHWDTCVQEWQEESRPAISASLPESKMPCPRTGHDAQFVHAQKHAFVRDCLRDFP
jgi:hypothetical protein